MFPDVENPKLSKSVHPAPIAWFRVIWVSCALLLSASATWAQSPGDCDHDGAITIVDALVAANHAATPSITGPRLLECDVDRSGDVDILDALAIARRAAGLPQVLQRIPCGDCNNDGFPDFTADLAALQALPFGPANTSLLAACDANGNGQIDANDPATVLTGVAQCSRCGDCDQNAIVDTNDLVPLPYPLPATSRAGRSCDVAPLAGIIDGGDAAVLSSFLNGGLGTLNLCPGGISPTAATTITSAPGGFCVNGPSNGIPWTATVSGAPIGPLSVMPPGGPGALVNAWVTAINALPNMFAVSVGSCFGAYNSTTLMPATITITSTTPTCTLGPPGTGSVCPFNPDLASEFLDGDQDKDGYSDGQEIINGWDPNDPKNPGANAPSSRPTAVDDLAVGVQGAAISVDPTANDVDADGDLDEESMVILEGPETGELYQKDDGSWIYLPDPDFIGTDVVHYQVCDEDGQCDKAVLGLVVMPREE